MDCDKQKSVNSDVVDDLKCLKMTISGIFDKLADCLNDDELKTDYSKKDGRVNWVTLRRICREELSAYLKEEWEGMWESENLSEKIINLRKIIENTPVTSKPAWRPKTGDIGPQCRSLDKIRLLSEKEQLQIILKEKEEKVAKLKTRLSKKWEDFRILEQRLPDHQTDVDNQAEVINRQFEKLYQSYKSNYKEIHSSEIITLEKFSISTENVNINLNIYD